MLPLRRLGAVVVACALAVALVGCEDAYERANRERAGRTPTRTSTPAPIPGKDRPSTPPAAQVSPGGSPARAHRRAAEPQPSPTAALRTFGTRWANWSWRDPPGRQRRLAALAVGRFYDYLRAQQAEPTDRRELARSRPASKGRVESVGVRQRAGARRAALVVVREARYARGKLAPDGLHYTVYRAEVARVSGGWAISRWEGLP